VFVSGPLVRKLKSLQKSGYTQWRRDAGDTLIEVTMALSILSMVLMSSTVVATNAFRLGQTAKEATAVSLAAQGQMEAVRAFRDNHTWALFLRGNQHDSDTTSGYRGMINAGVGTNCRVSAPCMHMAPAVGSTFVPIDGTLPGSIPTSYVELAITPAPGANPNSVSVTVNYGFEALGGQQHMGHIKTTLTNLTFVVPSPTPVSGSGSAAIGETACAPLPACLTLPPAGGSYRFSDQLENTSPVAQNVASCIWNFDDGTTSTAGCNAGDVISHTWPSVGGLLPYPASCPEVLGDGVKNYKVTLTLTLANGTKPTSSVYDEPTPVCY
jgi:type II secretory pathway pseudopilin PulG